METPGTVAAEWTRLMMRKLQQGCGQLILILKADASQKG
jgi:hypothetical protein